MIRLLQISDIHWLCCPKALDPHNDMRTEMLNDLGDYVKVNGKIDHLLICGDIAYSGIKKEYDKAKEFINDVCKVIGCKDTEVYVVPGNHDKKRKGNSEYLRKCINKSFDDENLNEILLQDILKNEFNLVKTLYRPFKDYFEFGTPLLGAGPLMLKCNDSINHKTYVEDTDTLYWEQELGNELGSYRIMLYGMNSAFCSDEDDFNGEEGHTGHKLFLSKLAYNIPTKERNTVNIMMAHHPLMFLTSQTKVKKIIDKKFKIQFYGHVHLQRSDNNTAVHIYSGALQPHEGGESKEYFPVYNIVEINISVKDTQTDNLSVKLMVQKWNKEISKFEEYNDESTTYTLPLEHKNRWKGEPEPKIVDYKLPTEISKRDIMIKFQGYKRRKMLINKIYPKFYDENYSINSNCVHFISSVNQNNDWNKLWDEIKD